jgi:hypothetical protein
MVVHSPLYKPSTAVDNLGITRTFVLDGPAGPGAATEQAAEHAERKGDHVDHRVEDRTERASATANGPSHALSPFLRERDNYGIPPARTRKLVIF